MQRLGMPVHTNLIVGCKCTQYTLLSQVFSTFPIWNCIQALQATIFCWVCWSINVLQHTNIVQGQLQHDPNQCNNCWCWGRTDPTHIVIVQNAVQGSNKKAGLLWESKRANSSNESYIWEQSWSETIPRWEHHNMKSISFHTNCGTHTWHGMTRYKDLQCSMEDLQALNEGFKLRWKSPTSYIFPQWIVAPVYFSRCLSLSFKVLKLYNLKNTVLKIWCRWTFTAFLIRTTFVWCQQLKCHEIKLDLKQKYAKWMNEWWMN